MKDLAAQERHPKADIKKIEAYIQKYLNEIKVHFEIDEADLRKILSNIMSNLKVKKTSSYFWDMIKSKL